MFVDDIEALVSETFSHSESAISRCPFDMESSNEMDFAPLSHPTTEIVSELMKGNGEINFPEQCPGVFYHIQKNSSTFVIRILESNDLSEDYPQILNNPEDYPKLRLLNDEETPIAEKLKFFECDSVFLAKSIKKELCNKRFPIFEENIFNVSDPCDSWWVKSTGNELKIYFNLSRTESMDSLIKLGPLADNKIAMDKFNKLHGYFNLLFPVSDFSCAHGQFSMSCTEVGNNIFRDLVRVFTHGDVGHEFWEILRGLEMDSQDKPYLKALQQANYFLIEISTIRNFWKQVELQVL